MDTGVPVYGTNSSSSSAEQHHNIFDMYQSFLGHFWGSERTGMTNMQDASGLIDQVFPGMHDKMEQAQGALNDPSSPISQIFGSLLKGL
jgi:hypothetical protein